MEEYAERRTVRRRAGLLTLLLLFLITAGAFPASHAAYLSSLSFKCQEGYVFSATNTVFVVDIAYLPPEDISVYLNSIPNNVELVSIKKVTYIPPSSSKQGYGTHVEITVRFLSAGDVKLFAADLETKDGFFKIPFPTVHVWTNMQVLKPELEVSIDGQGRGLELLSAPVGSHIGYTVRVKYVSSVRSISFEIPENSIFRETARPMNSDSPQSQPSDFSPNFQDAVRYDWQPLTVGDFFLPEVNLVVQSYSGNLVSLPFPQIKVHVVEEDVRPLEAEDTASPVPKLFEQSFEELRALPAVNNAGGSLSDAELLAGLYRNEMSSFPFSNSAMEERQALEEKLGRNGLPPLHRRPIFFFLVVLAVSAVVITLIFVLLKFFARAAFTLVIAVLLAVSAVVYGDGLFRNFAVSKGSMLYPIPETDLSQGSELPAASVVSILKQAGNWYYVSFNDTNGWISTDSVILVH